MIDIGLVFLSELDFKKLTGRFSDIGTIESINQLLVQNYTRNLSRTRAQLTDFVDMDFTENDIKSSEQYEK
ncbi:MAG: hypothetical protein ACXVBJ_12920 [Flavisolibacter sp.]